MHMKNMSFIGVKVGVLGAEDPYNPFTPPPRFFQ